MKASLSLRRRILITTIITVAVWSHIIWDYFHEGIPVHYILHNPNLPGIPNWVGAIVLPFFTWILLHRIHIRINRPKIVTIPASIKNVALRFFASALVAVTIAICFMNDINAIDYIMGSLFILAFIFPIYKSEFLLGWVVGSSFTFGAMLPIVFGSLIAGIFFLLYKIPRKILSYFTLKKE